MLSSKHIHAKFMHGFSQRTKSSPELLLSKESEVILKEFHVLMFFR